MKSAKGQKLSWIGLLLLFVPYLLTGCVMVAYGPSVIVGSLTLAPGGTGYVSVRIYGLNDLQSLQVGPNGRFTFDPQVIHVKAIEGINGFRVFANQIDNTSGEAIFLTAYPGGSKSEDGVVRIEVKTVGGVGASSAVVITAIDVLADSQGNDIADYEIYDGIVRIGGLNR